MTSSDIALLESIFTSASEGIIIVDASGKIILSNPSAQKLFGYKAEELLDLGLEDLMPERFRSKHPQYRESYFEEPKSRRMGIGLDLYALRSSGEEFPVEISLSSFKSETEILTAAFIIDVTFRKQQEAALLESEKQLKEYSEKLEEKVKARTQELEHLNLGLQSQVQERKIAEATLLEAQELYKAISSNFPNGIISVLDLDFKYLLINGAEMSIRNWVDEEMVGKDYLEEMGKTAELEELLDRLGNGEEYVTEIVFDEQDYRVHGVPLRDDEENVFQYLIVEENITNQKRSEEQMLESLNQARELNELKTRFVSMASHEFRTPLSTILSSVALIGKYPDNAREKREKHIQRIKSSISNLTNILNDFLSIGKLEEGKVHVNFESVALSKLMTHISEEMQPTLKKGQGIVVENLNGQQVYSDPKLLKNIFINLISNASKYSSEGDPIHIKFFMEKQVFKFEVIDKGMGIPAEEQHNLFTRFFRAGNATNIPGTGLGLNIVKKYVDMLEGAISFKSEVGKGTKFLISLPIYEENPGN